jgi:hypothetical protein
VNLARRQLVVGRNVIIQERGHAEERSRLRDTAFLGVVESRGGRAIRPGLLFGAATQPACIRRTVSV